MNDQDRRVREDYAVLDGVITACQPDCFRVRAGDGESAVFVVAVRQAPSLQPGVAVRVVFLRDGNRAVHVIDRTSGRKLVADFWRDGGFNFIFNQGGFGRLGDVREFLNVVILLVPFLGQFVAFLSVVVLLVSMVVQPAMKGTPSFHYGRGFAGLAVHILGSVIFFVGRNGDDDGLTGLGFIVMALGAVGYAIWARRPAKLYHRALQRLIEGGDTARAHPGITT